MLIFALHPFAVADLGEGAPPATKFVSISCSFWENLIKSYPGVPRAKILDPPLLCIEFHSPVGLYSTIYQCGLFGSDCYDPLTFSLMFGG